MKDTLSHKGKKYYHKMGKDPLNPSKFKLVGTLQRRDKEIENNKRQIHNLKARIEKTKEDMIVMFRNYNQVRNIVDVQGDIRDLRQQMHVRR